MGEHHRLERAASRAIDVIEALRIASAPINPLDIVESEAPLLVADGGNFRDRFDGQLEFHRRKNRFLLLFNTKYDTDTAEHHPRTRFSIAHELGHYFIERHHAYLVRGGKVHGSSSEFVNDRLIEREADTFAAHLLMPPELLGRELSGEVTFAQVRRVGKLFGTSVMSTAIRCVQTSDFPCALAAVWGGSVAWMVPSEPLVRGGCFPRKGVPLTSQTSRDRWVTFTVGGDVSGSNDALVKNWFETYRREDLEDVALSEEYHPVRVMGTMLVLLTLDEESLFPDDDEEADEADD
jgi:hypothetical protein